MSYLYWLKIFYMAFNSSISGISITIIHIDGGKILFLCSNFEDYK